jgi:saccharopine dehydrogenase (NAD+, L-lysine-forming)
MENRVETSKLGLSLRCEVQAAVLGTGGLGRIITLELASDPRVDEIVIADKRGDRSRALKSLGKTATVQALEADVKDPYALRRVLADADVAVNATLPEHNIRIMEACFDVGCSYIDTAGYSPTVAGEKGGVLDQLARDAAWQERGLTAIVSMGSDPGLSNVMARVASDRFATIDRILVRKAATGEKETDGFPLYSREIFLHDALAPPVVWDGTGFAEREPVSGEEDYEFPAPIGKRHVHLFRHEEVLTLPVHLGKPVGWVDYKHDIRTELVQAIHAFQALGLLDPHHTVKIGAAQIPFREAFLAVIPEPSTLIGPMGGALAIVVEIHGTKADGSKGAVRASLTMEHREANRRRGTTAERFLTAAASATGVVMILPKRVTRPGVLAPEELSPEHLLPELAAHGVKFHIEDLSA